MSTWGLRNPPTANGLYHLMWNCIDLIFPSHCAGCDTLGYRWCPQCAESVQPIEVIVCEQCGEPLAHTLDGETCHCKGFLSHIDQIRSYSIYEPPLSLAIHQLKYQNNLGVAESLANYLVKLYNSINIRMDLVIPIPLNKKRQIDRGYNQSLLLARPFSYQVSIKMKPDALTRINNTQSQVGLTRDQRAQNVRDAFRADPQLVKNKNIILIDDVSTTGSTMDACAKALKKEGANYIVGLTLARAVKTRTGFSDLKNKPDSIHLESLGG